ncbi:MAG TPA: carboxypeptidase-like regulatory domain-containing protein [Candidatus Sulfotelmatobacter sp.]
MRQYIPRRYRSFFFLGLPLLLTMILMFSPTAVQSQSASANGRLEGIVTDSTGAALPGTGVTVRNQNTGISTTLQSGAEGDFTFLYL